MGEVTVHWSDAVQPGNVNALFGMSDEEAERMLAAIATDSVAEFTVDSAGHLIATLIDSDTQVDLGKVVGDKGDKGEKGDTGDAGPANSLSIGTVTTGDAGTAAAATLTGQPPSQVLNLTIPRGVNGDGAVIKAGTGLTVSGAGTAANPLVVAQADTGWRDMSSMLMNGWTATTLRARRIGSTVYVRPRGLNGKAATSPVFADLSSLVAEDKAADGIGMVLPGSPSFGYAYQWGGNGLWKWSGPVNYTEWVADPKFSPVVAIPTSLPFPTTLPGTPA